MTQTEGSILVALVLVLGGAVVHFLFRRPPVSGRWKQDSAPKHGQATGGYSSVSSRGNINISSVRSGRSQITINGMQISMERGRLFVNGQEWGPLNGGESSPVSLTPKPTLVLEADGTLKGPFNGEIHIYGTQPVTLRLEGDVHGNVVSQYDVHCGRVTGDADAGNSVTCENVGGNVDAGGSVTCHSVGKDVDAGGSVQCGSVGGDVDAGGSVTCTTVNGDVDAGGHVQCGDVKGDVDAGGNVIRK